MTYQPQRIIAPDGTELVVMRAADYDRLVAAAASLDEDTYDMHLAARALAEGPVRYPAAVVDAILAGATPARAWRQHRGLSQFELAKAAGIDVSAVSKIEAGTRTGRIATRRAIARALNVPVSALDPLDD